jgi:hypothetical protein
MLTFCHCCSLSAYHWSTNVYAISAAQIVMIRHICQLLASLPHSMNTPVNYERRPAIPLSSKVVKTRKYDYLCKWFYMTICVRLVCSIYQFPSRGWLHVRLSSVTAMVFASVGQVNEWAILRISTSPLLPPYENFEFEILHKMHACYSHT